MSIAEYVDDLEQIVNALYEPPILMGHSMGALLDEARANHAKLVYESGQAIHEIGQWFLDRGNSKGTPTGS
jgi:predicted alpha/beta hydrolase family esterase